VRVAPHRVEVSGSPRRPARPPRRAGTLGERLNVLQQLGYRVTPQRRAILEGMLNAGRENVRAEEICRRARITCPTVNLATTYRTLDLFGRLGMVRRLTYGDGRSVFCPNAWPHDHGMCLRCGAVIDIPRGRVTKVLEQEQSKVTDGAFIVVDHRIEFYGYCAACGAAASSASGG
jgi:Fur family transcriptional regulator, ferric uptake regulator